MSYILETITRKLVTELKKPHNESLIGTNWYYHDDGLFAPGLMLEFLNSKEIVFSYRIIIIDKMDSYYNSHKGNYFTQENNKIKVTLNEDITTEELYWKYINNKKVFEINIISQGLELVF